jgi:acyl-CoA synthetase (AMP-forming)/AMP-acid ligase II
MDTLVDLVARSRRSDAPALRAPAHDQFYDYQRLCTTTWKTANFLHARGVRARSTVGVGDDARGQVVLAVLGSALLGAKTYLDPPRDVDARAVVANADDVEGYDLEAGTQRIAYGGEPAASDVYYFEGDVWSENPTMPPESGERADVNVALVTGSRALTHGELLAAAASAGDRLSLSPDTEVAVRAPLADPRAFAAGVLAPVYAGGTVVFPDDDATADAAVVAPDRDAPESRTLGVRDVEL